jgi:hypothetical protein
MAFLFLFVIHFLTFITIVMNHRYFSGHKIVAELRGLSYRHNELDAITRVGIPTIALGGAVELDAEWVKQFEWAAVLQRPFTIGNVADVVEELVGQATSNDKETFLA